MSADADFRLKDAIVFLTGAAGGVGREMTRAFHGAGATVAGADLAEPSFAAEDPARPDHFTQVDVAVEDDVRAAVDAVLDAYGRIDVLINNAGLVRIATLEDMTTAQWDETLDVNLKGAFFASREVVRHMKARGGGGRIINISSTAGRVGVKNHAHYCAAKAGLIGFTKGLALDLAPLGVTANTICPGPTDTKMLDAVFEEQSALTGVDKAAYEARVVATIPIGRKIPPAHVADLAVFLASPAGASITGQTLSVDGGVVRL